MPKKIPLTREQEGLWVEWKMSAAGESYNTCVQLCLEGDLDVDRFQQSASDVVDCFDLLRSYFIEEDGQPWMVFSSDPYQIDIVRVNEKANKENPEDKEKALKLIGERRQARIDLKTFPLNRGCLVQTAKDKFYFVGVVPHIISDGLSALFFLQALAVAYNEGKEAMKQKFDLEGQSWEKYLAFKAEKDNPEERQAAIEYWRDNLAGASHRVSVDNKSCLHDQKNGSRMAFELDKEQTKKLKRLCLSRKTSLFSGVAAIFSAFLHRYFSAEDLVIGYPVNLRPPAYKNTFGFFVNLLPLHVDLDGKPSLGELIGRVDQRRRADREHQSLPSLDIVKAKREADPEFDGVMFNVSMAETVSRLQTLDLKGIECHSLDNEQIEVSDDLSLMYERNSGKIAFWLEYRESSFSEEQATMMRKHIETLMTAMLEEPDQSISSIPMLGSHEQKVIVSDWNDTLVPYKEQPFYKFFEDQAESNPDNIALILGEETLTYKDLNERANQLSHILTEKGLKMGESVVVIQERSFEQLISILAILKAGGVYIPVEPNYPTARIQTILENSKSCYVLSLWQWEDCLPEEYDGKVLFFDALESDMAGHPTTNPHHDSSNAPAYIIYTSGSTGVPKGVVVGHHAVSLRLEWLMKTFPLQGGETVLQNTSYTFDVSVAETWWPLSSGASLVLSTPEQQKDPGQLVDLIEKHAVKGVCFVPSALNLVYQIGGKNTESLNSLQYVLSAGEALTKVVLDRHYTTCPQAGLYNVYGPTEGTIYASMKQCQADDIKMTIGQPIDNTMLYVLNASLQPQPVGVVGELFIGGPGLAAGYFGRDDLKGKFIKNPFAEGMIYRTGDLARYLNNGEVEYLGRNDDQVKIRGFRIELGEVADCLSRHDGVTDSLVIMIQEEGRHTQLCAYYSGEELSVEELRTAMALFLPDYMIPSYFVYVETWPRLPSGKINKALLPSATLKQSSEQELVSARTDQEKTMAQIWSDVLRVPTEDIGMNSNFFELGGDSLMAIQVATAAEGKGIHIEPRSFFTERTIEGLLSHTNDSEPVEFDQSPVEGSLPLMPRHEKLFTDGFVNPAYWNRCIMVEFLYDLDMALLQECFDEIVRYHDALRICFPKDEAGNWTAYNPGPDDVKVTVMAHDISQKKSEEQQHIIVEETNKAHRSFKLDEPPLIRPLYFRTGSQKGSLVIVIHHLLVDMRACRILLEDLAAAYQQKLLGQEIVLPRKTTSLKEWSENLYQFAQTHDFGDEVPYWIEQLKPDEGDTFPCDYQSVDTTRLVEKNQGGLVHWFSEEETETIQQQAAQQNGQMHEIILFAFAKAYFQWSGNSSFRVNLPGHGRYFSLKGENLIRTLGWVNTVFPMKIKQTGDGFLLETVQNQFKSMPHEGNHYFPLRFLKKEQAICQMEEPLIFLNYVSKVEAKMPDNPLIRLVKPPKGISYLDLENRSCYILYMEVAIVEGRLMVSMGYAKEVLQDHNAEVLFNLFCDSINQDQQNFSIDNQVARRTVGS